MDYGIVIQRNSVWRYGIVMQRDSVWRYGLWNSNTKEQCLALWNSNAKGKELTLLWNSNLPIMNELTKDTALRNLAVGILPSNSHITAKIGIIIISAVVTRAVSFRVWSEN